MIPNGSMARLIVFIKATVPVPSSSTKNSFFPIPTPCSPVPEHDYGECVPRLATSLVDNLQVPSSASACSTMRCTILRTVLSSSSVLKVNTAWKFPSGPIMPRHQSLLGMPWRFRTTHHLLRDQRQNKIRQSAPCPSGFHIRAAEAWKSGHCKAVKDASDL